ncbi:MAG: hypothetical protein QUS33_10325 [Dehalococcoidia bacterium]|nr:hypothetical protein [Dehalococcoidia bacterium]
MELTTSSSEWGTFLEELARGFSRSIRAGHIIPQHLQTTAHNKGGKVHNLVCTIVEQVGHQLGYYVARERYRYFDDGKRYRPDVQMWKNGRLSFLVEYESTNSSDSRIIEVDLRRYFKAIDREPIDDASLPEYWVILYTLPDGPVEQRHWRSWDFRKSDPEYADMRLNPHRFYKRAFKEPSLLRNSLRDPHVDIGTERLQTTRRLAEYDPRSRSDGKLFLLNLTTRGLEIDFPRVRQREVRF